MPAIRNDRLAEGVKKTLSEIIRELKDPRLSPMCTIMHVDLTPDLKFAKVKVSVYDEEDKRASSIDALNHAGGFIARELGARMDIRRIPSLTFVLDETIKYSIHIAGIIDNLKKTQEAEGEDES